MDLLHELVYVVELSPSRSFALLLPEGSKVRALYDHVRDDEFLTDERAAALMYQCAPSDKRYLMLKRNLIGKLSELILISELGDIETTSVKFYLEQRLIVAEKLLLRNVYHNAEKIGKKVRKEAEKESITEVQLRALQLLRKVYTLKGDQKAFTAVAEAYARTQTQALVEDQWLQTVQQLESRLKYTVAHHPEWVSVANWPEQAPVLTNLSRLGKFYVGKLQVYHAWHHYAVDAMERPLIQLEKLIAHHAALQTPGNVLFWRTHYIKYLLAMGQLDEAYGPLVEARKHTRYQSFDRFEVESLWFLYHTRKKAWNAAAEGVVQVLDSPQFDRLHPQDQSLWYVRGAYLHWLFQAHPEADLANGLGERYKFFSLEELYKNTAALSKDKAGGNLHVMLLRGLFTLLRPQEASAYAFDTGNTMMVYYQRYLKDLPEVRAGLFFRSVAKLLKRQDDPEKVQRLQEKMEFGLAEAPFRYDPNEWMPFEHLWNTHIIPGFLAQ